MSSKTVVAAPAPAPAPAAIAEGPPVDLMHKARWTKADYALMTLESDSVTYDLSRPLRPSSSPAIFLPLYDLMLGPPVRCAVAAPVSRSRRRMQAPLPTARRARRQASKAPSASGPCTPVLLELLRRPRQNQKRTWRCPWRTASCTFSNSVGVTSQ